MIVGPSKVRRKGEHHDDLPFGEWTKVFADPRLAKAVVDRLTHKAHIIETGEGSWRFRHGLARREKGRK